MTTPIRLVVLGLISLVTSNCGISPSTIYKLRLLNFTAYGVLIRIPNEYVVSG
jgi:hypothetical protein